MTDEATTHTEKMDRRQALENESRQAATAGANGARQEDKTALSYSPKDDADPIDTRGNRQLTTDVPLGKFSVSFPRGWLTGQAAGDVISTLDPKNPETKFQLLEAMDGALVDLASLLNKQIHVSNITFMPVSFADGESGEIIHSVKTVIHLATGEMVYAISGGVIKSLGLIAKVCGSPPWNPPLQVMAQRVPTKPPRYRFRLALCREQVKQPAKK